MGFFSSRSERLREAVVKGKLAKVSKLLPADTAQARSEINTLSADGFNLFHQAVKRFHRGIVQLLIDRGADVDAATARGDTPLHLAMWFGDTETARLLLSRAAAVDLADAGGEQPLFHAVRSERRECVTLLLDHRADPNIRRADGQTALMAAAQVGNEGIVELLIKRGADVEARAPDGGTALILASARGGPGCAGTMRMLIDRGANVNAQDVQGETALMKLVKARDCCDDGCKVLLGARGLDLTVRNNPGQTAREIAVARRFDAVAREIERMEDDRKRVSVRDIEGFASGRDVGALCAALVNKNDAAVKARAVEALGRLGEVSATATLVRAAIETDTASLVEAITAVIARFGPSAVERVLSVLDDEQYCKGNRVRLGLLTDVLNAIGGPAAVNALIALLHHPELALDAARRLGRLGDRSAVEPLLAAYLRGGNEQALDALAEIPDARSILPLSAVYKNSRDLGGDGAPAFFHRLRLVNVLCEIAGDRDRFLQLSDADRQRFVAETIQMYSRLEAFESMQAVDGLLRKIVTFVEIDDRERHAIEEINQAFDRRLEIERNRLPTLE